MSQFARRRAKKRPSGWNARETMVSGSHSTNLHRWVTRFIALLTRSLFQVFLGFKLIFKLILGEDMRGGRTLCSHSEVRRSSERNTCFSKFFWGSQAPRFCGG